MKAVQDGKLRSGKNKSAVVLELVELRSLHWLAIRFLGLSWGLFWSQLVQIRARLGALGVLSVPF